MTITRTPRFGAPLLMAAGLLLGGCSKNEPVGPPPPPADLESFFATLPSWESVSPILPDTDMPTGDPVTAQITIDNSAYNEITTPCSITRTPEAIVTLNPDVEVLWLGALLQGQGYLSGIGSLQELPIRQRAPMTVSIDLLTSDNSRVVAGPDQASVNQAIGELIQAATDNGHTAGSNIYYTRESTHSVDQASIKMGISASYMGASIKSSLEAGMSSEMRTVSAYFVQRMFTTAMVLPQTPAEVFSDSFTEAQLAEQQSLGRMGPANLPVFVSSIAYGRVLIFTFSSTALESEINATLNAVYNGGQFGGALSTEYQDILEHAAISVVAVGGDAENALDLIRTNNLSEYFNADATLTSAKPISYTVRNLADNTIATISQTTEYNLREFVPVEMVATGARFRIRPFRLRGVAFPTMDPYPVNPIWDYFNAEIYYDFDVQDAARLTPTVVFESGFGHLYAQRISADENHTMKNTDGSAPAWVNVDIHYDGHDFVRLSGDVWDFDDLDGDDLFASFAIAYRWPSSRLQAGTYGQIRGDRWGNEVRLYWTVEKIEDLYD